MLQAIYQTFFFFFWGVCINEKQKQNKTKHGSLGVGWGTYNADVDFVAGWEWGVTGYGHRMLQGEILHYVQAPQLLAHTLHSQALDTKKKWNES